MHKYPLTGIQAILIPQAVTNAQVDAIRDQDDFCCALC